MEQLQVDFFESSRNEFIGFEARLYSALTNVIQKSLKFSNYIKQLVCAFNRNQCPLCNRLHKMISHQQILHAQFKNIKTLDCIYFSLTHEECTSMAFDLTPLKYILLIYIRVITYYSAKSDMYHTAQFIGDR